VEITLSVPNAIIFLYDLASKNIQVPEYIDNVLVAANEACISVDTQADVDGEVTIKLSNNIDKSDKELCEKVFEGVIDTPGKKLAVSTSEDDRVLEVDVKTNKSQVSVWVDNLDFPGIVLVEAE
jgi:hypothetical protein